MDEPQPESKQYINRIHERALRIVYRDKKSTFKELLEKDNVFLFLFFFFNVDNYRINTVYNNKIAMKC